MTKKAFSRAGFEPAPLGKGHTYPVELPFILIVTLFYRFALYLKSDSRRLHPGGFFSPKVRRADELGEGGKGKAGGDPSLE